MRTCASLGWILVALSTRLALAQPVVIHEIFYAPADKTVHEEFIELYNAGPAVVDLSGWSLTDGVDYAFPPGTAIGPGDYLVVAQDPTVLESLYGPGPWIGPFSGRLANEGDDIVLRNAEGLREDEVDYSRGFPWPTADADLGYSIELIHPALDNELGGSWRLSNPGLDQSNTLVRAGSTWRFFRGRSEPSNPVSAWREIGFGDSGWESGAASIGYGESVVRTSLDDMRGSYSTVYLRQTFQVEDPDAIRGLRLEVQFDDGFNAWINGRHVAQSNVGSTEIPFDGTASGAIENLDFVGFDLPRPVDYLLPGDNVIAVQLLNASVGGSSDSFIDLRLVTATSAGSGPTPGAENSVFATAAPPQLRQVDHTPHQPVSGVPVLITVKATDPQGVSAVELDYQIVQPGSYIELGDPEYETGWTRLTMNDVGFAGDEFPDDDVYSVEIPASVQAHRRLIRYRIHARDTAGLEITAPYLDDPQPNFAYFVYDGVPGWSGAINPASSSSSQRQIVNYSPGVMASVPTYFLLAKKSSIEDATWFSKYGGSDYLWQGTLVYEGDVYDHIRYRARGGVWRYSMGKNMWKFDFFPGHRFRARDDHGRRYDTDWDKLNFSAIIQQGDYLHRGEQGLFEATGFRMFNLVGVESPRTHYITFRIIDEASEFGTDQYGGDFWGLYLVIEQMDGEFLEEHDLPDGNLYKMEGGTGTLNNLGFWGPDDRSDLDEYMSTYSSSPSDQWWRDNMDLPRYYSYRSIVEGIHHYDIGYGKNYFYFRNPETGLWSTLPWDLDLTWANNMFGNGDEPFRSRVLSRNVFNLEYRNRLREIRDLLYNTIEAHRVIDGFAAIVDPPGGGPSLVDADRAKWDYNPVMINSSIVNLNKAGHGRFYQQASTKDFPGMVQLMKNYVVSRGNWIDTNLLSDAAIPSTPLISRAGPPGYPIDRLEFSTTSFGDPQGSQTFGAMEWRLAEVDPPGAPPFDPAVPPRREITPVWESGELTTFSNTISVPARVARPGARYRARVRVMDSTGRWSHWSPALEFTAGEPSEPIPAARYLRITEIMYNPEGGADFEFVELKNTGPVDLDLEAVVLADGVEFDFTGSDVTVLPPGELVLVVKNRRAFETRYETDGLRIAGEYRGRLDNAGEPVLLRYGAGVDILSFAYSDSWYPLTDGNGHSLVIVDPLAETTSWGNPLSWQESAEIGGSPGWEDSGPPPGGRQLPGDMNQDEFLDIGDAVSHLFHLFRSGFLPLPCGGGSLNEGGNLTLADVNGDGAADVTDPIVLLEYLFLDGPPHVLGTRCLRIEGCPSVCGF